MTSLRRIAPTRGDVVDAAFTAVLAVISVSAFHASFGGWAYLVIGAVGVVVGLLLAHVANRLDLPVLAVAALVVLLTATVGGVVAVNDRAVAGVVPTLGTARAVLTTAITGWKQLLTTTPPVGAVADLYVVPYVCGAVAATATLMIARRTRAVWPQLIPPVAGLVLGLLCGVDVVTALGHGTVFWLVSTAWVALRHRRLHPLVAQHRSDQVRRVAGAVTLLAVAGAFGLVAGDTLASVDQADRTVLRETVDPPFDPYQFPSPLAGYRNFVKTDKEDVLFTITGLPEDVPIRMATMDEYDGIVWRVSGGGAARDSATGTFRRVGTEVSPDYERPVTTIQIEINEWAQVWLPTVGEVISVTFEGPRARELAEAYRYNDLTDTAAMQVRLLQPGDRYTLEVALPPTELAPDAALDTIGAGDLLAAPEELVSWAAPRIAKTERDDRPERLADELRAVGLYSDGQTPEQLASVGGHAAKRLRDFIALDEPVGNAEQYAAALGLMLRGSDLPARVVSGFVPREGEWTDGPLEITGEDAEAWVEVPVVDAGWVAIYPTPDREKTQPDERPKPRPLPERNTQVPPPPPVLVEDPRTDPASERDGEEAPEPEPEPEDDDAAGVDRRVVLIAVAVASPIVLALLGMGTVVALKARRRRRRRRRGEPHQRIANGWREVTDLATDLGRPVPAGITRREAAGFASAAAGPLALRTDAAVWGGDTLTDDDVDHYWSELVATLEAMKHEVGMVDRLKASVSVQSLWRRRGSRTASGGSR